MALKKSHAEALIVNNKRLAVINGLRGVAILGVIFHHSFFPHILYGMKDGSPLSLLNVLSSSGWLGVNLFFFLSGLVLYLPYSREERDFSSKKLVFDFYIHRANRLLPLFYFTTLILLVFNSSYQLGDFQLYKTFLLNIFLMFPFSSSTFFHEPNWVTWSLGVEIWFSVLFPFLVYYIRRLGWIKAVCSIILMCFLFRFIGRSIYEGDVRAAILFPADTIFGRLDDFVFGMLAAHLYVKNIFRRFVFLQFLIGIILVFISIFGWAWWYTGNGYYLLSSVLSLPFSLGLLLITNTLLKTNTLMGRIISIWPLQLAGMMCYSLYLWHGVVVARYGPSVHSVETYPIYLAITLAISWITYRYIEFRNVENWRRLIP